MNSTKLFKFRQEEGREKYKCQNAELLMAR
jgi:hypothetical protein